MIKEEKFLSKAQLESKRMLSFSAIFLDNYKYMEHPAYQEYLRRTRNNNNDFQIVDEESVLYSVVLIT